MEAILPKTHEIVPPTSFRKPTIIRAPGDSQLVSHTLRSTTVVRDARSSRPPCGVAVGARARRIDTVARLVGG
jgi:hypothetical protein